MNTKLLAKAILKSGDLLRESEFTINDLFKIRDALYILDRYNLADIDLLQEVEKYIQLKVGE